MEPNLENQIAELKKLTATLDAAQQNQYTIIKNLMKRIEDLEKTVRDEQAS